MSNRNILSLLGLALRGGNLVVGEEPVEAVTRARDARVVFVASDAAENTVRRVRHFAEVGQCLWLKLPFTKDELGGAVGRSSVAIVALTDIGLAGAVVRKLAEEDPKRYNDAAERLELKAKRAAERRAEQEAHIKNIRTGKVAKKKKAAAAEEEKKTPSVRKEEEPKTGAREERPKRVFSRKPGSSEGKPYGSRPSKDNRPKPRAKADRFAHSRPVKKGKGSFKKKQG